MTEQTMTPAEAAKLVDADMKHRVRMAAEAVQRAMSDYSCDLVAVPQVTTDGHIVAVVQIVAKQV